MKYKKFEYSDMELSRYSEKTHEVLFNQGNINSPVKKVLKKFKIKNNPKLSKFKGKNITINQN